MFAYVAAKGTQEPNIIFTIMYLKLPRFVWKVIQNLFENLYVIMT